MIVQLTKQQKRELIKIIKIVDAKKLEIDHQDERIVKWFRFGSYNGLQIACEIIKGVPEPLDTKAEII